MATRLLLIRHGQSIWNAAGRWQGQADPPLSALGRRQAVAAARGLGELEGVVSSTQIRAHETALIIAEALGAGPVETVPGLEERSAGPWSGLTRTEIDQAYPGYLESGRRPVGYESDASLADRTRSAVESLAARRPGRTLLVVTHGGVIHNLEQGAGLDAGRVPNLSGRVVSVEGTRWAFEESLSLIAASTGGDPHRL